MSEVLTSFGMEGNKVMAGIQEYNFAEHGVGLKLAALRLG
jgi:hypothetical protein